MHDTSARLVERVLPAESDRQWVLTVPFPLRLRIARDPGELSRRVLNLFRALAALVRAWERYHGNVEAREGRFRLANHKSAC